MCETNKVIEKVRVVVKKGKKNARKHKKPKQRFLVKVFASRRDDNWTGEFNTRRVRGSPRSMMTVAVASRLQLTDGSHVEEEFKREEKKKS